MVHMGTWWPYQTALYQGTIGALTLMACLVEKTSLAVNIHRTKFSQWALGSKVIRVWARISWIAGLRDLGHFHLSLWMMEATLAVSDLPKLQTMLSPLLVVQPQERTLPIPNHTFDPKLNSRPQIEEFSYSPRGIGRSRPFLLDPEHRKSISMPPLHIFHSPLEANYLKIVSYFLFN